MLMSIFSSFDALCAEAVGRKVGLSWAPSPSTTSNKENPSAPAVKVDDLKKGKEVNSSPEPMKDRRRMRAPRFAPELDGIHCFETILPY